MSTHCAIYSGAVMHRRITPRPHRFRYRYSLIWTSCRRIFAQPRQFV